MILISAQQNINKFHIRINQLKQYTELENSKEQFPETQWYSIEFSAETQNNSVMINSLPESIKSRSNLLKIGFRSIKSITSKNTRNRSGSN